ncbi:DUF3857 domain-containing protein [Pedobacter sp. Hv1]|uniref:DUF3857 domain-containing protein n=1 Tax=Pedobacter sp. Hv1 TaxID=1740090 RepID=UPI0006D89FAC|nr:DUF3857 domain-containing protein [Pedobacter sp. Hv1]KQC01044.1 transglutaminase [Pedobacter sp. Hv1]
MKKFLSLITLCFIVHFTAVAQDFNFGGLTESDYQFKKNTLDSNANAVVLKEFGRTSIQINESDGRPEIHFEYHVRIKIFNKDGFNHSNIVIPTYKDERNREMIKITKASTFNYNNGVFVETPLDKKAVFTEDRSKYTLLTKFTLPNIKEGSVIEYVYELQSPNLFNFKTWDFQSNIPKVYSEYQVNIPAIYNYNVSLRGPYKLTDQKTELFKECLRIAGNAIDCSKITYIMKNIPAFLEEDYMTAASNFRSAIYFELSDVQNLNGSRQSYTKTWKDVDFELTTAKNIGGQMKRKDVFKDILPNVLKNATDELSKAKAIYNYIKKQIKWNNYYGKYSEENIKDVVEMRSGNVADINLSLIAALSAAGLDAEAVILSTRENGTVNKLYPVMSDFNYIVAKVNIANKSYLLDATEPLLPFGLLPLRCINDQGRVINLKKPSYWIDLKADQKNVTNYILSGALTTDGKIKGTITTYTLGYAAFNRRKEIKKYNSIDEFVEKLDEQMPKLSIVKHEILNIDSVENTLTERYDVEFTVFDGKVMDQVYFNPFFINRIAKNPFNLNDRTYPIDLGAASDERINISVTLPEAYELIEKPKDMAIALPENGGRYLLQTSLLDNKIAVNQVLQFSNAIYPADHYLSLKEFYSRIIQNQKKDLLLKKTK